MIPGPFEYFSEKGHSENQSLLDNRGPTSGYWDLALEGQMNTLLHHGANLIGNPTHLRSDAGHQMLRSCHTSNANHCRLCPVINPTVHSP